VSNLKSVSLTFLELRTILKNHFENVDRQNDRQTEPHLLPRNLGGHMTLATSPFGKIFKGVLRLSGQFTYLLTGSLDRD